MTRTEYIKYYKERIEACNDIIKKGGKNTIRFKNNKKLWNYRLKKLLNEI